MGKFNALGLTGYGLTHMKRTISNMNCSNGKFSIKELVGVAKQLERNDDINKNTFQQALLF